MLRIVGTVYYGFVSMIALPFGRCCATGCVDGRRRPPVRIPAYILDSNSSTPHPTSSKITSIATVADRLVSRPLSYTFTTSIVLHSVDYAESDDALRIT